MRPVCFTYPIVVLWLLLLVTAACSRPDPSLAPAGEPLVESLPLARQEVARWEKEVVLTRVGRRYTVEDSELILEDHTYLFVSTDGAASHFVVRIRADSEISSIPVAGKAVIRPEAYDFSRNVLSEQDALKMAWERYGQALVDACGPLRWVDVSGGVGEAQYWRVGYRIGGTEHAIFLDAVTGATREADPVSCG